MQCKFPTWLEFYQLWVPCGKCFQCRLARRREWTIRMMHELGYWESSCFVTLTYSEENLPSPAAVSKPEAQRWLKRVRWSLDGRRIKYYLVGEYGEQKGRPHYHAILFGVSPRERAVLLGCWLRGNIYVGTVSRESIQYVAGYIHGALKKRDVPYPTRPFALSSQGLGKRFVQENEEYLRQKLGFTVGGRMHSLPAYYRRLLGLTSEDLAPQALVRQAELQAVTEQHVGSTSFDRVHDGVLASRRQNYLNAMARERLSKDRGF